MIRRAPWHSERLGDAVHHDHEGCADGQSIPPVYRAEGTAGRPLCKTCAQLAAKGGAGAKSKWDEW